MKTILALDLGTKTGWAYRDSNGVVTAGTWILQTPEQTTAAALLRRDRTLDMRVPILYRKLKSFWEEATIKNGYSGGVDFLVFEDVQFSKFTLQTQLWSSLRAAVWLFAFRFSIPRDCCPVSTLKKFATGSGNAPKPVMMEAAKKLFPHIEMTFDDNAADALCLLQWAINLTKRAKA
jgi:Holliday junction resolvasome RuvABC endonuclease subunit